LKEKPAKPQPKPPDGYEVLLCGEGQFDVYMRAKARKDLMKKASAEQRAGLSDLVEKFAAGGPGSLPTTKFNGSEGWFPSDKAPGKVRLQAFKPWQLRAYGFAREFNGRPSFFITGIDPSKKQDRADQEILAAAGKEAADLNKKLSNPGGPNGAVRKGR
jgi:hypothetical protein